MKTFEKEAKTRNDADLVAIKDLKKALNEKDKMLERAMIENEFLKNSML